MIQHTYLFEEGTWHASGTYIDGQGNSAPLSGVSRIRHGLRAWDVAGRMTIEGPSAATFENNYTFTPFKPGQVDASWTSVNPALGQLSGHLVVVDDCLLLQWRTKNGDSFGMECLRQIDSDFYSDRGTMFAGNVRVSTWSVDLRRI